METPGAQGSVFFVEQFSKIKVLEIPDTLASYPRRDTMAHLLWNYTWDDDNLENIIQTFGKQTGDNLQASSGLEGPQFYVNYGHGDKSAEALYSARNLPRLRALKTKWDPDNVFRFNHSIWS